MALYLTEADVRSLLTVEMAIDCLEEGFRSQAAGNAVNLPRRRIALGRGSYNVMSAAWLPADSAGTCMEAASRTWFASVQISAARLGSIAAVNVQFSYNLS